MIGDRFIVGEVSKSWEAGYPVDPRTDPICVSFELMLNHNLARGYRLHSFQIHQLLPSPTTMTETLIAVFERIDDARNQTASPVQ